MAKVSVDSVRGLLGGSTLLLAVGCSGAISEDTVPGEGGKPPGTMPANSPTRPPDPVVGPGNGTAPFPPTMVSAATACQGVKAAGSPARIFRLSGLQYENTVRALHPSL